MKFKEYTPFKTGDTRTKTGFLWFPKTLSAHTGRNEQTRWLERASWTEVYYVGYWEGKRWLDD